MASLSAKEKRWIVEQLAVFETPQEVADAFPGEFNGRTVTRQQVANYDASKEWAQAKMARSLVALFVETRERFRKRTDDIAIANKAFRLKAIERVYRSARSPQLQLAAIEQAAKESGDAYTNVQRHRITGKTDDAPIATASVVVSMPDNGRGDRLPAAQPGRAGD